MEEALLFIVEAAFQLSKRGCVLAPGLSSQPDLPVIRVGSPIRLVQPGGQVLDTHICGIEMLNYGSRRPEKITFPILLPAGITKEQVPAGTKVFLRVTEAASVS